MPPRSIAALLLGLVLWVGGSAALAAPSRVIALVALPGAGKTTAAQLMARKLSAPKWTSGDVIRNTIAARGLPYTLEHDNAVRREFAGQPGEIGRRVAAEIAASPAELAIVEGFRSPADVRAFRQTFPRTTVVSIEVGTKQRHARMLARGRAGEVSESVLRERDRAELGLGVRQLMRRADFRLRPGDGLPALERSVDHLIHRLHLERRSPQLERPNHAPARASRARASRPLANNP